MTMISNSYSWRKSSCAQGGAVYKCSASRPGDCSIIPFDTKGSHMTSSPLAPPWSSPWSPWSSPLISLIFPLISLIFPLDLTEVAQVQQWHPPASSTTASQGNGWAAPSTAPEKTAPFWSESKSFIHILLTHNSSSYVKVLDVPKFLVTNTIHLLHPNNETYFQEKQKQLYISQNTVQEAMNDSNLKRLWFD